MSFAAWMGDFIDPSSAQIAAGAALVEAAAVVIALLYAKGQLDEAKRTREATERPFVVMDLDVGRIEGIAHIVVKNYGNSLARNVKFSIDPPLRSSWHDLKVPRFIDTGIPSLAPGREITFSFDGFVQRHAAKGTSNEVPEIYTVTLSYEGEKDRRGEPRTYGPDVQILDFAMLENLTWIERKTVHDLHKEVKKLRETVETFGPRTARGILTWTDEQLRAHDAEREDARQAARARSVEREVARKAQLAGVNDEVDLPAEE